MRIAVVGGGPIGLYTSIALAKKGYHVDVFEKREWPVDKACGQGIMNYGVELLKKVGMAFEVSKEINGIKFIEDDGLELQGNFLKPVLGVERKRLSDELFELASNESNIKLHSHSKIESIALNGNEALLSINGSEHTFDYVFACDGLNSFVRDSLNLTLSRRGDLRRGARVHYKIKPWSNYVEVYWANGIEAYVTPVSNESVEIAYLWYDSRVDTGRDLKERILRRFPKLEQKLKYGEELNDFKASPLFSKYSKKIRKGNIFFIGDSFYFLDGITGDGISLGLHSADIITKNFENFSKIEILKINLAITKYWIYVKLLLFLSSKPSLRKKAIKLLKYNKSMFEILLNFKNAVF